MLLLPLIAVALLVVWPFGDAPELGRYIETPGDDAVAGQLIVQFRGGADHSRVIQAVEDAGATFERELNVEGFATVRVPPGTEDEIGRVLAEMGGLETVERNGVKTLADWAPNDPVYSKPDMDFYEQWNLQIIQMEQAWDEFPKDGTGKPLAGAGAIVAVVDTGVAFEEWVEAPTIYRKAPDLAGTTFADPYDAFDDVDPGDPSDSVHPNDVIGHGTHVTGTIAQATNNGFETAGIAFRSTIIPVRVCEIKPDPGELLGVKTECPNDRIAEGINWAVDHGADVINLSLEGDGLSSPETEAIERAADAGVVMVAATGNAPIGEIEIGIKWPAQHEDVLAVGAVGRPPSDEEPAGAFKSGYSRYGPGIELVAPGGAIRSPGDATALENSPIWQGTYAHNCPASPPLDYKTFTWCGLRGTSMATAHVSGVAALIKSMYPSASRTQVKNLLTRCALDLGPVGYDLQQGNGLVQAYDSIKDVNGDGIADGLQDTDNDSIFDCKDDDVIPPPTVTPKAPPPNECLEKTPTPVLTPSPTPTLLPTPTPTETLMPTDTPTETLVPTDTPVPTGTPVGSDTATPVPSDTPTPLLVDTPTPTPTDTPPPSGAAAGAETDAPTLTLTPTPSPTPTSIACGDTDCDLDVDAVDALNILKFVAAIGQTPFCLGYGYTDCNGKLEATDALIVLKYVAGLPFEVAPGCLQIGYG